jgi:hypothetical protein
VTDERAAQDRAYVGGGIRGLLLRLAMRLQARTLPCMSWAPGAAERAEAEAAAERIARRPPPPQGGSG